MDAPRQTERGAGQRLGKLRVILSLLVFSQPAWAGQRLKPSDDQVETRLVLNECSIIEVDGDDELSRKLNDEGTTMVFVYFKVSLKHNIKNILE